MNSSLQNPPPTLGSTSSQGELPKPSLRARLIALAKVFLWTTIFTTVASFVLYNRWQTEDGVAPFGLSITMFTIVGIVVFDIFLTALFSFVFLFTRLSKTSRTNRILASYDTISISFAAGISSIIVLIKSGNNNANFSDMPLMQQVAIIVFWTSLIVFIPSLLWILLRRKQTEQERLKTLDDIQRQQYVTTVVRKTGTFAMWVGVLGAVQGLALIALLPFVTIKGLNWILIVVSLAILTLLSFVLIIRGNKLRADNSSPQAIERELQFLLRWTAIAMIAGVQIFGLGSALLISRLVRARRAVALMAPQGDSV